MSGAILAVLWTQLDLEGAAERLRLVEWRWIAMASVASLGVLAIRGLRFHALVSRASLAEVTAAVSAQNFLNRVTPFRLGELSLPLLLKRVAGEPGAPSLVSLLLVRLVELWALLVIAGITVGFWFGRAEASRVLVLSVLALALTLALWAFRRWLRWSVELGGRIGRRLGLMKLATIEGLHGRLLEALADEERLTLRQKIALFGGTALMLAINFLMFHFLLRSLDYEVRAVELVLAVTASQITGALPVPSVGSVGTHEAGWVAGFVWIGMPLSDAVLTGVLSHTALIVFAFAFAVPSGLYLFRRDAF